MTDHRAAFRHRVRDEALACIGCNECMLACPLEDSEVVTIAALNLSVLGDGPPRAEVREFALDCTQCRMCVPVCPADLSRADMVLWNKQKVLDGQPDRPLKVQVGDSIEASGRWLDSLTDELLAHELFRGSARSAVRRTVMQGTLRRLGPGELLFRAGQWHDRLWVVIEGSLEHAQELRSGDGSSVWLPLTTFGPGSFHGQQSVLGDRPEPHHIRARVESVVLELPKFVVLQLEADAPAAYERVRAAYEGHRAGSLVQGAVALQGLAVSEREELVAQGRYRTLRTGDCLVRESRVSSSIHVVLSGFLRVTKPGDRVKSLHGERERVFVYLQEGDVVGVQAALQPAQSLGRRIEAATRVEVFEIPREALARIVQRAEASGRPGLRRKVLDTAIELEAMTYRQEPEYRVKPGDSRKVAASSRLVGPELAMAGILQGRELLVIDQRRCVDCDNCVDACGRRHGRSRLVRSGPVLDGDLLIPAACRHCDDPVCLLCSVGGIVRLGDGQISIVEEACIGCGACASRCPYDNIRMHPKEPAPRRVGGVRRLAFDLWDWVKGAPPRDDRIDAVRGADAVAVKCNLCAGHEDYACVTACPTGAAFRVADPDDAVARARARGPRGGS